MISEFERTTKRYPNENCFTFIEANGDTFDFRYEDLRLRAVTLALLLQKRGVNRGSLISVDMSNCPSFIILILAAAYGGFSLVVLNHRLTDEEKNERLADLRLFEHLPITTYLDELKVERLLASVDFLSRRDPKKRLSRRGFFRRKTMQANPVDSLTGRPPNSDSSDVITEGEVLHFAERSAAFFDLATSALVLFTSGTSGRPKAVSLTWGNLCGAAETSNNALALSGAGLWQAVLPLYHIGGFEVVVRSIMNETPFMLYRRFDPERVLRDAGGYGATHVSVVDKMLQDFLETDLVSQLRCYECILLGGAAPNPVTLVRAVAEGAQVYASYGMTETSSLMAAKHVQGDFDGTLSLLPGYEAEIVTPDERGIGQLAVRGPGVFSGYLNAQAAFTVDGFFLTGDNASLIDGQIKVQERITDMFVSGGENIYPAEVEEKLQRIPGVRAAFVFSVSDAAWGRRPVAFIEREPVRDNEQAGASLQASVSESKKGSTSVQDSTSEPRQKLQSPQTFADELEQSLKGGLSKLYQPRHICVMDELPRLGIGKINREEIKRLYDERLEIKEIRLFIIKQKLKEPIRTAKTVLRSRESILVEVKDWAGRTGIGECVAFQTSWYLPETLGEDAHILEESLIPLVLNQVYLHPREVSVCFNECEEARDYPLAKAALEPALWDLYGKIVGAPLKTLLGGDAGRSSVAAGLVLGIAPIDQTLEAVSEAIEEGYTRVKLKISPNDDIERVRAVRKAFPDLSIILDANQSYTEREQERLISFNSMNITCIEEPLDPQRPPDDGPAELMPRLARLQKILTTPICLDESLVTQNDYEDFLKQSDLTYLCCKLGKFGGIQPALDYYRRARKKGKVMWMGGMYDTGVSKRMHAAFETLPGIDIPGDLSSSSNYYAIDISSPPFKVQEGSVVLNPSGFEHGLGCALDYQALDKVLIETRAFSID